jgi:hypothetical protein
MAVFDSLRRRMRPRWLLAIAVAAIATVLLIVISAGANLAGSTFESADGDLAPNTATPPLAHDWNNPVETITCPSTPPGAGTNCGTDLTKSGDDNAFGQGAKEDISNPTEVTGSIPPNKSDLTRFYVNKEKAAGSDFLYLAWERSNVLGSANMDFEFNQSSTLATGKVTPLRTAGDILVTFDFTNGGSKPVLGLLRWLTAANGDSVSDCLANNALPCWGKQEVLGGNIAEGAINTTTVHDAIPPPAGGNDIPASEFGEAGINLTAADVFPQDQCVHFGSAFLKSRSSASFPAELKDFIAPIPVNIANCGSLSVHKYIDINENAAENSPGESNLTTGNPAGSVLPGDLTGWGFTITGPNSFSCTGSTNASGILGTCLKADNTAADLTALPSGSYTVKENATSKTIGSNSSAIFNTDPGPAPAAPPVTKTINLAVSGTSSAAFGNSCYATATFQVNSVPSSQSGLFARYTITAGPDASATPHDVLLVKQADGTTYKASVGSLRRSDSISWSYGINHGTASEQTKAVPTAITLSGYPSCSGSGSVNFATSTVSGTKYKDINGNGAKDAGEGGLQGFGFQLKDSGNNVVGTTQRSDSTGAFSFSSVAPGTYTIHEVGPPTGWVQTEPASGGDETVTVNLGVASVTTDSTGGPIRFGDTPKSNVSVTFNSLAKLLNADGTASSTNATKATSISCTDGTNAPVGSTTTLQSLTTNDVQIKQSSVTCVITYTDP